MIMDWEMVLLSYVQCHAEPGAKTMMHEMGRHATIIVAFHPGTMETDLSGLLSGNVGEG